jgi:hypothetical protein
MTAVPLCLRDLEVIVSMERDWAVSDQLDAA